MRSFSKTGLPHRLLLIAAAALLACWLQGCATEADGVMPWATPLPGEGSVPLPAGFMRQ